MSKIEIENCLFKLKLEFEQHQQLKATSGDADGNQKLLPKISIEMKSVASARKSFEAIANLNTHK